MLHNAKTCFSHTDEKYLGTWFGHDIYQYQTSGPFQVGLLATCSDNPGDYCTCIWDAKWLDESAKMGIDSGTIPMHEHMLDCSYDKAFLFALAKLQVETLTSD